MVMQIAWAPANEPCNFQGDCIACKASLRLEVEEDSLPRPRSKDNPGAFGSSLPLKLPGEMQKSSLSAHSKAYCRPRNSATPGVYVPADVKYNFHCSDKDLECQTSEHVNNLQGLREEEEEDFIILIESSNEKLPPLPHKALSYQQKKRGKSFTELSRMQKCQQLNVVKNPYQCPFCDKEFFRAANLRMHKLIHSAERPHKCPVCQKGFIRTADVWRHLRSFHKIERSSVVLERANLKNHWSVLPHSSSDRWKSRQLDSAMRNMAEENPKRYACPVCSKRFRKPSLLSRHKKIHRLEKPHKCKECGMAFAQWSWLKRHQQIHTGVRPFCCKECGSTFTRLGSLKRHQSTHT
uniref:C2H2-type domain-containing protein n=1 Tax=Salvator merianae TaxID=96440 RepID=A0A8D0BXG8_SALMN